MMSLSEGLHLARMSITEQDLGIPQMRRGERYPIGDEERLDGVVQRMKES